jgi:hypothetical protein
MFIFSKFLLLKAILHPKSEFNTELIRKIIDNSYWPIFGEVKLLDQLDIQNCYSFDRNESQILKNENSYATAYECLQERVLFIFSFYSI